MTSNNNFTVKPNSSNGTIQRNGDHALPRPPRKPPKVQQGNKQK